MRSDAANPRGTAAVTSEATTHRMCCRGLHLAASPAHEHHGLAVQVLRLPPVRQNKTDQVLHIHFVTLPPSGEGESREGLGQSMSAALSDRRSPRSWAMPTEAPFTTSSLTH